MNLKATSLFLGLCLAALAAAASPAHAADLHETAFGSFHVEINTLTNYPGDPYLCMYEYNGAVVNACCYTFDLEFGLPIETLNTKHITVLDGWSGLGSGSENFSCQSFSYTGTNGNGNPGTNPSFTGPGTSIETTVTMPSGYTSIQVLCNVPAGDAVANLTWNP